MASISQQTLIDPLPSSCWCGDSKRYKAGLQETGGGKDGKVTEAAGQRVCTELNTWCNESCRIWGESDAERRLQERVRF